MYLLKYVVLVNHCGFLMKKEVFKSIFEVLFKLP